MKLAGECTVEHILILWADDLFDVSAQLVVDYDSPYVANFGLSGSDKRESYSWSKQQVVRKQ